MKVVPQDGSNHIKHVDTTHTSSNVNGDQKQVTRKGSTTAFAVYLEVLCIGNSSRGLQAAIRNWQWLLIMYDQSILHDIAGLLKFT